MQKFIVTVILDKLNTVPITDMLRRGWKLEIEEMCEEMDTNDQPYAKVTAVRALSHVIKEELINLIEGAEIEGYEWISDEG